MPGEEESLPPESERLTLEDALRAYTIDAAYVIGADDIIGSVEVGKRADMILIDTDIFSVSPEQLADTKVLLAMMNGRVVHGQDALDEYAEDFSEFEEFEFGER